MNRDILIAASLAIALLGPWPRGASGQAKPVHHTDVPVTGKHAPGVELLDAIMLKYRRDIGCSAASLTIARGHQLLYSRGYGWLDRAGTRPMHPDTPMGVASCDKPWEEAAIRQTRAARQGRPERLGLPRAQDQIRRPGGQQPDV